MATYGNTALRMDEGFSPATFTSKPVAVTNNGAGATVVSFSRARGRKLAESYGPLVDQIVKKMQYRFGYRISADELRSTAWVGLMDALRRYDSNRAIPFEAFARSRITGAILDEVRSADDLSRPARKRARAVAAARKALIGEMKREPETDEIAKVMGEDLETFHRHASEEHAHGTVAMEDLPDEARGMASAELSATDRIAQLEQNETLTACLTALPARERSILASYYWEEVSLKEIGKREGVSESRVCQIMKGAQNRMRQQLAMAA